MTANDMPRGTDVRFPGIANLDERFYSSPQSIYLTRANFKS